MTIFLNKNWCKEKEQKINEKKLKRNNRMRERKSNRERKNENEIKMQERILERDEG